MCRIKKGITLIEVIVYLSLISVVFLITFVNLSSFKKRVLESNTNIEIEDIELFVFEEQLKSKNKLEGNMIYIKKNEIRSKYGENVLDLSTLEVQIREGKRFEFHILSDGSIGRNLKFNVKDKFGGIYVIEVCKGCNKVHTREDIHG